MNWRSVWLCGVLVILAAPAAAQHVASLSKDELLHFFTSETVLPLAAAKVSEIAPARPNAAAGTVKIVQGTLLIMPQGGAEGYRLQHDLPPVPVYEGDMLLTGKDSRALLLLHDGSSLLLAAQSKILLEQAPIHSGGDADTRFQLLMGKVRAVVSRLLGDRSFRIKTPTAIAGVRGTDFALAVGAAPDSPSRLLTALTTGNNSSVMLKGETGGRVKIGSLSAASAAAGQPASQPLSLGPAARQVLRDLAPELERAAADNAAEKLTETFWGNEQSCGLERAVRNAVNNGAAPAEILAVLVRKGDQEKIWAGLNALRCAGVDRMSVRNAAQLFGIAWNDAGRGRCRAAW